MFCFHTNELWKPWCDTNENQKISHGSLFCILWNSRGAFKAPAQLQGVSIPRKCSVGAGNAAQGVEMHPGSRKCSPAAGNAAQELEMQPGSWKCSPGAGNAALELPGGGSSKVLGLGVLGIRGHEIAFKGGRQEPRRDLPTRPLALAFRNLRSLSASRQDALIV